MKKLLIILSFIIVITILTISLFIFNEKPNPYIELGYSENDLEIINKLNNPEIILEYEYSKFIIELIKNKDFKEENLKNI